MTKAKQSEQNQAIESLRETLKPGDTVYTILRSVSRSGMSRVIDLVSIKDGDTFHLGFLAAKAMDDKYDREREGIKVGGCGMDMGFHIVYNLARTLFRDQYVCTGEDCTANDHSNAYSRNRQGQCAVCRAELGSSEYTRLNIHHQVKVCSEKCGTGEWKHSDAGYALKQRWL